MKDWLGNEIIYIKPGYYVKTYKLCTGEIVISQANCVINEDEYINVWSGNGKFEYKNGKQVQIKPYTAIWDKLNYRFVFKLPRPEACFSTIIVDASEYLETLLVDNEKVTYDFDNYMYEDYE